MTKYYVFKEEICPKCNGIGTFLSGGLSNQRSSVGLFEVLCASCKGKGSIQEQVHLIEALRELGLDVTESI